MMLKSQKMQARKTLKIGQRVKKLALSSAVVATFAAYAIHDRTVQTEENSLGLQPLQPKEAEKAVAYVPTLEPTIQPTHPPTLVNNSPNSNQVVVSNGPKSPTTIPATPIPPTDVPTVAPTIVPTVAASGLHDGQYTGDAADASWGDVQVAAVIESGRLTKVNILQYPDHRRLSQRINQQALPYLQTEAIQAQSARVDIISGATLTSEAFMVSLQSALNRAKG